MKKRRQNYYQTVVHTVMSVAGVPAMQEADEKRLTHKLVAQWLCERKDNPQKTFVETCVETSDVITGRNKLDIVSSRTARLAYLLNQ